jgi:hypothetical protein
MWRIGLWLTLLIGGCGSISFVTSSTGVEGETRDGPASQASPDTLPTTDPAADEAAADRPGSVVTISEFGSTGGAQHVPVPSADPLGPVPTRPDSSIFGFNVSDPLGPAEADAYALGFELFELGLLGELLPWFPDDESMGLMSPEPSGSSVSYLEQVCRDSGIPEFYCRRLYGY